MLLANVGKISFTAVLIAASLRLSADGGEKLSRFCAFRDCREYIDATCDLLVHPWDLDTPERARSVVEFLVKNDSRKRSLDALSAAGMKPCEIEDLLVVEWQPAGQPYRALYCGDKICFIRHDWSGNVFIRQFDNETARTEATRLRELLAGSQSRGALTSPARDSTFLFFTDLKSGKSVLIHEPAIRARRRPTVLPDNALAPLYDGAMALVKELGIELWK